MQQGDPSISTYFGVPVENNVTHDPFIPMGLSEFTITADPYSYVGVSKDGILHGSGFIGESGSINLVIDPIYTPGEVLVIITGQNKIPYFGEIFVASPDGAYTIINSDIINSGDDDIISLGEEITLELEIENLGTETASNIELELSRNTPLVNAVPLVSEL